METDALIFYAFQVIGYCATIAFCLAGILSLKEKRRAARYGAKKPHSYKLSIWKLRRVDGSISSGLTFYKWNAETQSELIYNHGSRKKALLEDAKVVEGGGEENYNENI